MPHFGVFKTSETTPLRIVYDCSFKSHTDVSLNDFLEAGPPLKNNMLEIILQFRVHRVGLTADISKAFHQILLHPADESPFRSMYSLHAKKELHQQNVAFILKSRQSTTV